MNTTLFNTMPTHKHKETKLFLPHVAGLRAIAISAVLLFHFTQHCTDLHYIKSLSCGYFGVDVFFVIMGYLLIKGWCKPEVAPILPFMRGKLLRLLPAHVVTVLLTFIAGLIVLDFEGIKNMSSVGLSSLFGWSNVTLKDITSGYFSSDARGNPFLHTWYLSVTLQLLLSAYIVYRILRKLKKVWIITILSGVGIVSAAIYHLNDILTLVPTLAGIIPRNSPYYDTFPRVWELLAGGCIILLPACNSKLQKNILSCAGLLLIIIPFIFTTKDGNNNGLDILVVVGTMLVVRYTAPGSIVMPLLSNKPVMFLGAISYSVYLVHMPILVMYRMWTFQEPSDGMVIILFTLSLAIGYFLWWAVEKRIVSFYLLLVGWLAAMALCVYGKSSNGFKNTIRPEIAKLTINAATSYDWQPINDKNIAEGLDYKLIVPAFISGGKDPEVQPPLRHLGSVEKQPSFIVIGDSHIYQTAIAMDYVAKRNNFSGIMLDAIILPFWNRLFVPDAQTPCYSANRAKTENLFSWLKDHDEIKVVIIAQYWKHLDNFFGFDWEGNYISSCEEELKEFLRQLKAIRKDVILLEPTPEYQAKDTLPYLRWQKRHGNAENNVPKGFECNEDAFLQSYKTAYKVLSEIENENLATVLHLRPFFFNSGKCPKVSNGKVICSDTHHLTADISIEMGKYIEQKVKQVFKVNLH